MPFGDARQAAVDAEIRAVSRRQLLGLSPYERHVRLVAEHSACGSLPTGPTPTRALHLAFDAPFFLSQLACMAVVLTEQQTRQWW
jgi:hypothetical protein